MPAQVSKNVVCRRCSLLDQVSFNSHLSEDTTHLQHCGLQVLQLLCEGLVVLDARAQQQHIKRAQQRSACILCKRGTHLAEWGRLHGGKKRCDAGRRDKGRFGTW